MAAKILESGTILGAYRVIEKIGAGSMGIIYKVSKDSQFFAAKLLLSNDAASIARFRKETAAISRLSHPSLVKVVDVGEHDGEPFMVMELVLGETVDKKINEYKTKFDGLLNIFSSVAGALSEVHRFRMVHRDVKPENVIITNDGRVKLLDLGLVGAADEIKDQEVNTLVGTALYSSPEQSGMLKRPVDARSDLYSLGVMMFELAAGRAPFASDNISELLQMHASRVAPRVTEFNPTISPVIDLILTKLLSKDPDDRYQTAKGLLYDLEHIADLEKEFRANKTASLGSSDHGSLVYDVPLVGRDFELKTLNDIWESAKGKSGGFAIVEGEGGNGKSRLIQEALIHARKDTQIILKGKCQKIQNGIPFFPFREAFDDFLLQNEKQPDGAAFLDQLRATAGADADVIRIMSRGLEKVFSNVKSKEVDQQVFNQQFTDFLLKLSSSVGSIVIVIDDIQWADDATINLLAAIAEQVNQFPFLLLMSARNDKDSIDRLTVVKERVGSGLKKSIALGPLSLESANQMITFLLGGKSLDKDITKKIYSSSNGNPFAIGEFARSLLESGNLQLVGEQWRVDPSRVKNLELSRDVFQIVLSRVEALPDAVKRVLTFGAVIGNVFDLHLMSEASGDSKEDLEIAVEAAVTANLLERTESDAIKFVHDRIRESLISSISQQEYRNINTSLAKVLDAKAQETTDYVFDLARYYASGNVEENRVRVMETNLKAGQLATQNFSYEQAYGMLALTYDCCDKLNVAQDRRMLVIRDLVQTCILTGRLELSHKLIDEYMKLIGDQDKTEALYLRLKTLYAQGFFNEAWETAKDAIEEGLKIKYPKYFLGKLNMFNKYLLKSNLLAITGFGYGAAQKRSEAQRKQLQLVLDVLEEAFKIVAIYKGNSVDAMVVLYLMQVQSHYLGDTEPKAKAHVFEATFWGSFTFAQLTKTFLDRSKRIVDKVNNPKTTAFYLMQEQWAIEYGGDSAGALKKLELAYPLCRRYLEPYHTATVAICKLLNLQFRGFAREVIESSPEVYRDVDVAKQWTHVVNARLSVYESLVLLGQPREAVQQLKENFELVEKYCKDTKITGSMWAMARLMAMSDMDEKDVNVDLLINYYSGFKFQGYYAQQGMVAGAYIRLAQFEKGFGTNEEIRTRRQLGKVLRRIYRDIYSPLFRCHYFIVKAGFYRISGNTKKALAYLDHAYKLVLDNQSLYAFFQIFRERAKVHKQLGNQHSFEADLLLLVNMCERYNWSVRLAHLRREFGVNVAPERDYVDSRTSIASAVSSPVTRSPSVTQTTYRGQEFSIDRRIVNALLQVSAVSMKSSEPTDQASYILDEVVRLFGAERGFVFLKEGWETSIGAVQDDQPETKETAGATTESVGA